MSERQQDSITHSRTCEECGRQTYQFERCHHCGDVPWKANRSWDTLGRLWERVTTSETTIGCRSGGWKVQMGSDEGLVPIREPEYVAVYLKGSHLHREVGRWPVEEVLNYAE